MSSDSDQPPIRCMLAANPGFTHTPALARARAIARVQPTALLLYSATFDKHLTNWQSSGDTDLSHLREIMLKAEVERLEEMRQHLDALCESVTVQSEWHAHPVAAILEAADRFEADYLLISSQYHSPIRRMLLNNTDWDLMRHSSIPVLMAHHEPLSNYRRILVAADVGEEGTTAALDNALMQEATRLCSWFDAELHIVHAYPSQRTMHNADYVLPTVLTERWREQHTEATLAFAQLHDVPADRVHLLDERPPVAIELAAERLEADLVVMGVTAKSVLEGLMIGHTTESTLDRLKCDVLALPATGGDG